ncbi:acid protease [Dacryopinax primogenitus]|uniref:Acid protease n=1 Tax=Dacryopinax primogenitus (strain DJM 731) TaxID=1858805 RepID=M5FRW7_DACPD|nr:acid protease [Dacryopinax primogenitus]EJT97814.1 acid protease [Dacryopinax primogenitus]
MFSSVRYAALALLATELLAPAAAVTFQARQVHDLPRKLPGYLSRRDGQIGEVQVQDESNTQYVTEIIVNGDTIEVSIDAGSSDLNVEGTVPGAKDLPNVPIAVDFAEGNETGVMSFATVEFAGHTVQNQVFNHVPVLSFPPLSGLIGLGPSVGSRLWMTAQSLISSGSLSPANAGDSVLDRIFQENTSAPNFISFTLGREDDATSSATPTSVFTVGDLIPGYENISSMPKLDVINAPTAVQAAQHFTILVDGFSVGGQAVNFPQSVVPGTPSGKLVAVLDSGFTFPQVVPAIANAMYQNIPGAVLNQNLEGAGEFFVVPCGTEIDAIFQFGGNWYPIHALDANFDSGFAGLTNLADEQCIGAFQPIQDDATAALEGLADMILGMAFLRNTYTLLNYGNFVDSNADVRQAPFVQLLSVTNQNQSSIEFHQIRGGTAKTFAPLPGAQSVDPSDSGNNINNNNGVNTVGSWIQSHLAIVIGVSVGVVVLILLIIAFCCCRRRRPVQQYQNISAPAPMGQYPYPPYRGGRNFSTASVAPLAGGGGYDDPFRETFGPEHIPLAERNAQGNFAQPQRAYAHSPQPSLSVPYDPPRGHSPQPSLSAPYDPPLSRGHSPQPSYSSSSLYDPPQGPPPAASDPLIDRH